VYTCGERSSTRGCSASSFSPTRSIRRRSCSWDTRITSGRPIVRPHHGLTGRSSPRWACLAGRKLASRIVATLRAGPTHQELSDRGNPRVLAPALLLAQDPSSVAPGAKLERCSGGLFTEGPAPAPDGSVYFSDITVGQGVRLSGELHLALGPRPDGHGVRSPSGMSNGSCSTPGTLVVAEGRRSRPADHATDMKTGRAGSSPGCSTADPSTLQRSSARCARAIYFTDPR